MTWSNPQFDNLSIIQQYCRREEVLRSFLNIQSFCLFARILSVFYLPTRSSHFFTKPFQNGCVSQLINILKFFYILEQYLMSLILVCTISIFFFRIIAVLLKILSNKNRGQNLEDYRDITEQKYVCVLSGRCLLQFLACSQSTQANVLTFSLLGCCSLGCRELPLSLKPELYYVSSNCPCSQKRLA
jgi:hypothetical protein